MFNGVPISWKLDSVVLSTSEAECCHHVHESSPPKVLQTYRYSQTHVRELSLDGVIKLVPLGTDDMVADALTKSLPCASP